MWLTSHSPSSSLPVSAVQGKLPWRPAAPTAVWASTSVPGSEVRKTIKPRQDGGKKCIVGGPQFASSDMVDERVAQCEDETTEM